MATVLVLLDGFRHDYLSQETTPFLWTCAQTGAHYGGIEQSLGYCERTELLTGLRPDESGFFTAIGFDPQNSPFAGVPRLRLLEGAERVFLRLASPLPARVGHRAHKAFRRAVSRYFRKLGIPMPVYLVPFSWLPFFALTEDRVDHRRPEAFPTSSILQLLEEAGKSYYYDTFTALGLDSAFKSDDERLLAVIRDVTTDAKDLYLVFVGLPDAAGHQYGPDSSQVQDAMHGLDRSLQHFVNTLERQASGNRYLFLGDHGMVPVTAQIDAERAIKRLLRSTGLVRTEDVVFFLDSTMVRIWAVSDKARDLLPQSLEAVTDFKEHGSWMDAEIAERSHVPWPDRRYGDYLWLANPGVLVFPDYFSRLSPAKGMHGYDPTLPESRGMCIHWGQGIAKKEHDVAALVDVFGLLKEDLQL